MSCKGDTKCSKETMNYTITHSYSSLKSRVPSNCPGPSPSLKYPTKEEKDAAVKIEADKYYVKDVEPDCPDGCTCWCDEKATEEIVGTPRIQGEDIVKTIGNCTYTWITFGDLKVTHTIKHGRCYHAGIKTAIIDDNQDVLVASTDNPFVLSSKSIAEMYKTQIEGHSLQK